MEIDDLMDRYYEVVMEEGIGLVSFIERALAGQYGPPESKVLYRFLDQLEIIILGNIETKLEEVPASSADAEAAADATRKELAAARDLIATQL